MRPNPDDRSDNVERIQFNITNTIRNIEAANEMIAEAKNQKTKIELAEKNRRRERALDGMRDEIKDEWEHRERNKH